MMVRAAGTLCGLLLLLCGVLPASADQSDRECPGQGPAVQVLGSGGPVPDVQRASSAYLVWLDGRSRALVDAGGGTFLRFSEAGARIEDLWFVGLSHFHTDHSAELPAFIKGAYFSDRSAELPVIGPQGARLFPGLEDFLAALFNEQRGAFRYLSGFLSGGEGFRIQPIEIDHRDQKSHLALRLSALELGAMGVPHGIVPALAFRVEFGGRSVVFASDQNGSSEAFIDFARGTDLLVMHMAIPETARGVARQLHAPPSWIGKIAEETGAGTLLLSHFMNRSIATLDANLALVREQYSGSIVVAQDLLCIPLAGRSGHR